MKKDNNYHQNSTANLKYDFIYSGERKKSFTCEQVSIILDKVTDTLGLLNNTEDSVEATNDLIYWLQRDLLDTDK